MICEDPRLLLGKSIDPCPPWINDPKMFQGMKDEYDAQPEIEIEETTKNEMVKYLEDVETINKLMKSGKLFVFVKEDYDKVREIYENH